MICYSGGAAGSDMIFEIESIKRGIKVIAFSFDGHNTKSSNTLKLNSKQLIEGFEHIKIANLRLNRNINNISTYIKKLISRDWFQVKYSDSIFAIGTIQNEDSVMGGTGYAVSCAIDEKKPIYFFEQNYNQWYYYDYESNRFEIYEQIPKLTEKFAGIGTRNINDNGVRAILKLFNNISIKSS